jgi:hypothetical protein
MQSNPIFTTSPSASAISGRKSTTCYACIKNVPNTVLNFGIFYTIYYFYIFILSRIKFHFNKKNSIKYFFSKKIRSYCYSLLLYLPYKYRFALYE